MSKKEYIVLAVFFFIIAVVHIVFIYSNHKKTEQQEQEAREQRLELYSSILYIEGDFDINGTNVTINNKSYDEKDMTKDVCLYNVFYENEPVTIEMLMEEFDSFCRGMEESELLETYLDRNRSINNRRSQAGLDRYSYDLHIISYLKDVYNIDISDATVEQMQQACPYAAEELYNEILAKEEEQKEK